MPRKELCAFGKEIGHALVEINKPKKWLIEQVRADTGLYFDRSYLGKIQTGELATPGIVASICRILDLPCPTHRKEGPQHGKAEIRQAESAAV